MHVENERVARKMLCLVRGTQKMTYLVRRQCTTHITYKQNGNKKTLQQHHRARKEIFPAEGYLVMKLKFDIDFYDDLVIEMKGMKDFQKIDKKEIDDSKRLQRLCLPSEKGKGH